ncbi:MAG: hypothetical protein R2800_08315 [Flavipsychrobacter sp.]
MKLSTFLIVFLIVVAASGCKEEYQEGRYRLVEETTYKYGWSKFFDSSVVSVLQYRYKEDSSGRRTYENPRADCDTFLRYTYEMDGEVRLLEKEVRSYNHFGLQDTAWQYRPYANGKHPISFTAVDYTNDTLPTTSYTYTDMLASTAMVPMEKAVITDTVVKEPHFTLLAKVVLAYKDGKLTNRVGYGINNDSTLVMMGKDIYIDGQISVTEEYVNNPDYYGIVDKETPLHFEKRYIYDSAQNRQLSNTYIVSEEDTLAIWHKEYKQYDDKGQLVEHKNLARTPDSFVYEGFTRYTYTPKGAVATMLSVTSGIQSLASVKEVKYSYNSMGKLIAEATTQYEDTARTQPISQSLVETTYDIYGKKATTSHYLIEETAPKEERKKLVERKVYTYEAY